MCIETRAYDFDCRKISLDDMAAEPTSAFFYRLSQVAIKDKNDKNYCDLKRHGLRQRAQKDKNEI